jgi:mRNA interferase MazF
VRQGELWLADVGGKSRPVLIVTRDEVLDVRANVTVAEVTTRPRGLAVEVPIDVEAGVAEPSVVNCDGLHTVSQRRLSRRLGAVDASTFEDVCDAVAAALGCDLR